LALWVKSSNPSLCVLGSDIDPEAIINAAANADANELDVAWAQGDLLDDLPPEAPWDAAYDCILWNYPFWQGRSHGDPIDHIALDENGHLLRRFFGQLPRWLVPGGKVFLSYSTLADVQLLFDLCERYQFFPEKIAEDAGAAAYQRQV
jgi:methylase of polypeptide subunit release factors